MLFILEGAYLDSNRLGSGAYVVDRWTSDGGTEQEKRLQTSSEDSIPAQFFR